MNLLQCFMLTYAKIVKAEQGKEVMECEIGGNIVRKKFRRVKERKMLL